MLSAHAQSQRRVSHPCRLHSPRAQAAQATPWVASSQRRAQLECACVRFTAGVAQLTRIAHDLCPTAPAPGPAWASEGAAGGGQHSAPAPLLWLATYRSDGSWHTGYRPVNTRYPTRRLIRGGGAPAHPSRSNCESLPGRGEGASVLVCVPRLPDTHNPVAHAIHARYDAVRHRTNSSAAPPSQMRADRALRSWDAAALRGREDAVVGHPPAPLLWRTSAAAAPTSTRQNSSYSSFEALHIFQRGRKACKGPHAYPKEAQGYTLALARSQRLAVFRPTRGRRRDPTSRPMGRARRRLVSGVRTSITRC